MPNSSHCRTWPVGPWPRWVATPVRELADDPSGITPELWDRLVSLGWTGMLVPGEGAGLLEMCIVLEQMGRVPLPGPFFSSSVMATLAARALGADDPLGRPGSGRDRGTVALHEQGHGHPMGTVRARARRKGAGWVVTEFKPVVVDGHTADWAIVVALSEEGVRSFLLPAPKAEVVPTLDPTRKLARWCSTRSRWSRSGHSATSHPCGAGSSTTSRWPWPPSWSAWPTGRWTRRWSTPRCGSSSTGPSPRSNR
jgi:alkylation response protein AidB-like acyl-CoA dehydrogenase